MIGLCARCLAVALAAHDVPPDAAAPAPEPIPGPRFGEAVDVVGSADDDAVERARSVALDREALAMAPAETLAESLGALPGVVVLFATPFGGTPMVLARGFFGGGEVDYVGLEIDGVPRADLENGVADWGALRLADVERVDYLPGPSFRRGGVDPALAGAVRIVPREADDAAPFAASLSLASFSTESATFAWRGDAGGRLSLFGNAAATGGYRDHAAAEAYGIETRWERAASAGDWTVAGYARRRDREEPGPLSEEELARDPLASNELFADDRERADRWGLAARYRHRGSRLPFEARLELDGRDSSFLRTLLLADGFADSARREADTGGARLGLSTPGEIAVGERWGLRFAADARHEEADVAYFDPETGAREAAERARRARAAAELGVAFRPHPRLELDGSLRAERIDDRYRAGEERAARGRSGRHDAVSPRLGLVWRVTGHGGDGLALVAEAGRAFKAPTLDQLYDPRPFPAPDGSFTISNPELSPQRSRNLELGTTLRHGGIAVRLLAYRSILEDEIDFDPATFRYGNIGRSRHEGIELSGELGLARFGALHLSWAHGSARAEGAAPTGQLKNLPLDVARLAWRVRLPAELELDLRQSLLAGRWADDANLHELPDAWRTDLRIARRWGAGDRLRITLDLLNATDDDALELAYLLPDLAGGETLYGFAPAPRALRAGLEARW